MASKQQTSKQHGSLAQPKKQEAKYMGYIPMTLMAVIIVSFMILTLAQKHSSLSAMGSVILLSVCYSLLEQSTILKRIAVTWLMLGGYIFGFIALATHFHWWVSFDNDDIATLLTNFTLALIALTPFLFLSRSEKSLAKQARKEQAKEQAARAQNGTALAHLTFEDLQALTNKLIGQDKAQKTLLRAASAHDGEGGKPFSALFCGASGVGKTQLAENIAAATGIPLTQFNMGEISGGTSTKGFDMGKTALIGMPSGYVDAEKGGIFTNALAKNPAGIFLFDEMEKAGSGVYDIFLNCLDKGWINDARGKRYDCSKATFLFTTNVARDVDPDLAEAKIRDKMVRAGFRPELMGRINKAIVFRAMDADAAREIALAAFDKSLTDTALKLDTSKPSVSWKPQNAAVDFFLHDLGYEIYGVRSIMKGCKELASEIIEQCKAQGKDKVVLYPIKHSAPTSDTHTLVMPLGVHEAIDLDALRSHVLKKVKGQDAALETVVSQLEMREAGMVAKLEQPEGTFLFSGPSGTGKTELVKQVADYLDRKFIFFNMGNFKGENGVEAFFGPPPGYEGSDKGGQLTQAILDNPDAIILLDEIEKANAKIWDAFMSVFDDGFAKDTSTGEEVSFAKTMIFMTSNIVTEYAEEDVLRDYLRESGYFRPEMVNRIEHIVSFKPLGDDVKADIVRKVIQGVLDNYNRANGSEVAVKEEWVTRFAAQADFSNGVRDIQRKIQKELMQEIINNNLSTKA